MIADNRLFRHPRIHGEARRFGSATRIFAVAAGALVCKRLLGEQWLS